MTGLLVSIFKDGSDCTNNGFSSKKSRTYVFSDEMVFGNISIEDMTEDYLVITEGPYSTIRAVPKSLIDNGLRPMFGGNFIYTSDSRFSILNGGNPIKIFDRVE